MERIAPLRLAEKWDNVGLLLEAPTFDQVEKHQPRRILLTIDLTPPVLQEALVQNASVIIAYHTPIFTPLSALTLANPLQASLLRCVQAGISVYSPHTSLDSVHGGINDWLAGGLGIGKTEVLQVKDEAGGAGRMHRLAQDTSIDELVGRVKKHLGLSHVQVARPHFHGSEHVVKTIGICAGAGGSMLSGLDADVYFTGEMAHHEVLAAIADGKTVVLCGHTNTERGYLPTLEAKLRRELSKDDDAQGVELAVSQEDRHPLSII